MTDETGKIKGSTASSLKWNSIDRFSTQVLYAITGIVLANVLPKEDFGLVGAILTFQAFGILFVDSGFGAALLQKKDPSREDYSTVFWFNLIVSVIVYIILYFCAPFIAHIFQNNMVLIPLSRVMFLSFILNGLGIVQTNRLMKAMDVKQIAIANLLGLTLSGGLGIYLALEGYGAWALVWQTIALAAIKSGWLWITGGWVPSLIFSMKSLKSIYRVGLGVFSSSLLNTIFLNIYSFIIAAWDSMLALGLYTQADKWSKMGHASLSQIVTATFVPLLSRFQDSMVEFRAMMCKVARLTGFITIPFMAGLTVMATPIFHTLFSTKWDDAIILFQILMLRGIFVVYISLCSNYLLSLGYAKSLVYVEVVKDVSVLIAILVTLPMGSVEALVWGQMVASVLTFAYILLRVCRLTGSSILRLISSLAHYILPCMLPLTAMALIELLPVHALLQVLMQIAVGLLIYILILKLSRDPLLNEAAKRIFGRFHRNKLPAVIEVIPSDDPEIKD